MVSWPSVYVGEKQLEGGENAVINGTNTVVVIFPLVPVL